MHPLFSLSVLWLVFIAGCGDKQANGRDVAAHLLQLERQAIEREFANDTGFLSAVMDSTFIELNDGRIKRRHDVLRTIYDNNLQNAGDSITLDSFQLLEPVVHVYGEAAVVTFVLHTFRKKRAVPLERKTRVYDLWVKRGNQWKAAAWQASPYIEQAGAPER